MTPGAALAIDVREGTGEARAVLSGELDRSSVPRLEAALATLERSRPAMISLELSGLSFIDAGGLRAILQAARRAEDDGRRLVVSNPSAVVRRLLAVTAIDRTVLVCVESG